MSRWKGRVHPSVRSFDRGAERYERNRPGYPPAAVRYLVRELGIGRGRTIVDLASGTGKLTRALLPYGAAVVAVEPTVGMRRVFERELPRTAIVDGTAEAMPLPDGFADAIVVAQAFHWFRTGAALREIRRVLRPGGGLGLVWNVRDPSLPFTGRIERLLSHCWQEVPPAPGQRWRRAFRQANRRFGRLSKRSFRHGQRLAVGAVVEEVLSVSSVASRGPAIQRQVAKEVRAILAADPTTAGKPWVTVPYRTEVYVVRRGSP